MFTIKHITASDVEHLYEVESVTFEPKGLSNGAGGGASASPARLMAYWKDGHTPIQGGTAFVMNTNGKTVARYDLGASNVPLVGDGLADMRPREPLAA